MPKLGTNLFEGPEVDPSKPTDSAMNLITYTGTAAVVATAIGFAWYRARPAIAGALGINAGQSGGGGGAWEGW